MDDIYKVEKSGLEIIEKSGDLITVMVSQEVVDSDNEIIDIDSIDLEYFQKQGNKATWEHKHKYHVGDVVELEKTVIDGVKSMIAKIKLKSDAFGKIAETFIYENICKMVSIGGFASHSDVVKEGDYTRVKNLRPYEVTFTMQGANPNAYILAKSIDKDLAKEMFPFYQEIERIEKLEQSLTLMKSQLEIREKNQNVGEIEKYLKEFNKTFMEV